MPVAKFHSYSPQDGHGLKHSPFKALIAPRPIGWISSVSATGAVNLAPYSFFNAFCELPPIIGFCSYGRKDSLNNIEATGEFVHNVVGGDLASVMNQTSGNYPHGISEMDEVGLEAIASDIVAPPRVAGAPAAMECKLIEIKQLQDAAGTKAECYLVLGEVVRIHIDTAFLKDGLVDEAALAAVSRLGYFSFSRVDNLFSMTRPKF